jgi:hypothetical protein
MFLDVTLIIKLLKNDKLMKFCYLDEDSEDVKPDAVKVLAEDFLKFCYLAEDYEDLIIFE